MSHLVCYTIRMKMIMKDIELNENGNAVVDGTEYEVRGFDHEGQEAIVIHELDLISYDEGDNWEEMEQIMTFNDLKFSDISETHGEDAIQAYVELPNGFDVSVVKHRFSYGGEKGLYEIGVFDTQRKGVGVDAMCDPCDWGDTVKGWLNESDVEDWINVIKKL